MVKNIICINCPIGCPLTVNIENGSVTRVEGQNCSRGEIYAKKECVNPTRIFTSSIPVENGKPAMLSVKTAGDVPKSKIPDCIKAIAGIKLTAPVKIGDVVADNFAFTGVKLVATRNVDCKE